MPPSRFIPIGILGGMGPEATAEFYKRIIRLFQERYGCVNDSDYPDIFIYSLPLPEIVNFVDQEAIGKLQMGIDKLVSMGAGFIACPCNTANTFFRSLKFDRPYVCIFDAAMKKVKSKNIGIIGTKQTMASEEFQSRLKERGIIFQIPNSIEQQQMTDVIMRILSGKKLAADRILINKVARRMECSQVILGCTELPLLTSGGTMIDTLQALAEDTVEYSAANYIKKPI
jgi:aspartate racemase